VDVEIFEALEQRVEKLVTAYRELKERVGALEAENANLRAASESAGDAGGRIAALEAEREELRRRLERLLASLNGLDV
jgi:hypothetical protein